MKKLASCGKKTIWLTTFPDEQQFYYEEDGYFRRVTPKIAWEYIICWHRIGKRSFTNM